jgi:hypothetical protein
MDIGLCTTRRLRLPSMMSERAFFRRDPRRKVPLSGRSGPLVYCGASQGDCPPAHRAPHLFQHHSPRLPCSFWLLFAQFWALRTPKRRFSEARHMVASLSNATRISHMTETFSAGLVHYPDWFLIIYSSGTFFQLCEISIFIPQTSRASSQGSGSTIVTR